MNTPPMYSTPLTADFWAEVYANMRIHAWADIIDDLEWSDPDAPDKRSIRGTAADLRELWTACCDAAGDFYREEMSAAFENYLYAWLSPHMEYPR